MVKTLSYWGQRMEKLENYVERFFQRMDRTTFPTVRECARALGMTQAKIEELVDSHDNLMLTSYLTEQPTPLGQHWVEAISDPEKVRHPQQRVLGLTEVAEAVGVRSGTLRAWLHRLDHGYPATHHDLPKPDERLATGPIWFTDGPIGKWIRERQQKGFGS